MTKKTDKFEPLVEKALSLPNAYIEHNVDTKLKKFKGVELRKNDSLRKDQAMVIYKLQ